MQFSRATITRITAHTVRTNHYTVPPVQARQIVADYIRNNGLRRNGDYQAGALMDGDMAVGRYAITPA